MLHKPKVFINADGKYSSSGMSECETCFSSISCVGCKFAFFSATPKPAKGISWEHLCRSPQGVESVRRCSTPSCDICKRCMPGYDGPYEGELKELLEPVTLGTGEGILPQQSAAQGVQHAQSSSAGGSTTPAATTQHSAPRKHNHYFKNVKGLRRIDVYRVLELFEVTNPSIAHATKKLLVAGGRGAGKDISQDIKEAIDSLQRWQEMRDEDAGL